LKDINLDISEGKITAIIGATGSGKTTLVQHLNGLLIPTSGSIEVLDRKIVPAKKLKDVKTLRQQVGLVFQFAEYQLFEETILKDVAFGPRNFGVEENKAYQIAAAALTMVGIDTSDFEKSPLELSGGQKRRVAIAGILAMAPKVLVLDEPAAGLDPQGAKSMMELFQKLNKEKGITIIIVTHNMEHVLQYCDDVVVLEKGQLVAKTDIESFFEKPEYMQKARIDAPKVVTFKEMLKDKGVHLSDDIFDVDELAKAIKGYRR